jgi:hypothetical protein
MQSEEAHDNLSNRKQNIKISQWQKLTNKNNTLSLTTIYNTTTNYVQL